jgi:hypothetical protein
MPVIKLDDEAYAALNALKDAFNYASLNDAVRFLIKSFSDNEPIVTLRFKALYRCGECGKSFQYFRALLSHAKKEAHRIDSLNKVEPLVEEVKEA